ncbi:MAG TPA: hypothetical protein VFE25_05840 [Opitutaceae bacterium]|nr:hypothetical protein [Opitutaceae bacterium]
MKTASLLLPLCIAFAGSAHAAEAKTYTLFEGENISVGQGGVVHPVRDVNGSSWVIVLGGEQQLVSGKNGPVAMKVTPAQKLTDVTAMIENLKSERGYTFANDPSVKLTQNVNNGALVDIGEHTASNQATAKANEEIAAANSGLSGGGSTSTTKVSSNDANQAGNSAQQAGSTNGGDLSYMGQSGGSFDALDVAFDVTSEKDIQTPYFVVITKFHAMNAPEGASQNLIYAKALDPITHNVSHVKFEQGGFPPGYQLISFELHLYNNGIEIATNVSPGRKSLSSDEAFDYVKTKYIAAHKGETLGAAPVMGSLPDDLRTRIVSGKYADTVYVRVSKDGTASEAFEDAACTKKIDDSYLESVVHGILFKPALIQGEPVAGVAPLNLSRLRI